jgi:hypothetical protein
VIAVSLEASTPRTSHARTRLGLFVERQSAPRRATRRADLHHSYTAGRVAQALASFVNPPSQAAGRGGRLATAAVVAELDRAGELAERSWGSERPARRRWRPPRGASSRSTRSRPTSRPRRRRGSPRPGRSRPSRWSIALTRNILPHAGQVKAALAAARHLAGMARIGRTGWLGLVFPARPAGRRAGEWAVTGSNRRPPACKAGALPAELTARAAGCQQR